MPMINIEYDNEKITSKEIIIISEGIQKIVSKITNIEDVFVYANSSQVKIKIAPIEIFIRMSENKIKDSKKLIGKFKAQLSKWKKENQFKHLINLTLIPMKWDIEIGI